MDRVHGAAPGLVRALARRGTRARTALRSALGSSPERACVLAQAAEGPPSPPTPAESERPADASVPDFATARSPVPRAKAADAEPGPAEELDPTARLESLRRLHKEKLERLQTVRAKLRAQAEVGPPFSPPLSPPRPRAAVRMAAHGTDARHCAAGSTQPEHGCHGRATGEQQLRGRGRGCGHRGRGRPRAPCSAAHAVARRGCAGVLARGSRHQPAAAARPRDGCAAAWLPPREGEPHERLACASCPIIKCRGRSPP